MAPRAKGSIPQPLWEDFLKGDRRACAKLITLVENQPRLIPEVHALLSGRLGKALRIGITGPPGVGKSTLTSALAKGLAEAGHRVGVIAVDPSSPFTGGAFMGDRVRMEALVGDPRVYVRSLASRQGHGGLSPSTPYVADVIEGFGMDRILVETVGVGQAEIDVLAATDLVVLVLQPSTGDAIQTMKAGIIEAADLIVVNKADLPGVETVLQSLRFLFSLGGPRRGKPIPAVVSVSAQRNEGIDKVLGELSKLSSELIGSGKHLEMRRDRMVSQIKASIQERLWDRLGSEHEQEIMEKAAELASAGESPYPYVEEICTRIETNLKKERA